ncbi:hypothetical protein E3N88_38451 [Mikania micrantha]|uniref:Uncharacterized protein n=1 Tax=Mikania micrantha TaxID=192012 RepID=A0A5N6LU23_9ASTR|nr:hypothetical protein E3N88_38451 [Mikania micrantha]
MVRIKLELKFLDVELQNDPCTNAGRGSNFTEDGHVECDTNVMDDKSGAFRAVGTEPVVDDKTFLEDNMEDLMNGDLIFSKIAYHITDELKKPILDRLDSPEIAVRAIVTKKWSPAEWAFFNDQILSHGLNMAYCIEDVEDEENGMAQFRVFG